MLDEGMDRVVGVIGVRKMNQLGWPINMMTSSVEAEVKSFLGLSLRNSQDPRERGSMDAFTSHVRPLQLPLRVDCPEG